SDAAVRHARCILKKKKNCEVSMRRLFPLMGAALGSTTLVIALFAANDVGPPPVLAQPMTPMGGTANQPGCLIDQPAFCDTFDTPFPTGNRTGQLDPSRWSIAHVNTGVSVDQG